MLNQIRGQLRKVVCPFEDVLAQIPEHSALFDIGCGTGSFLELAAKQRQCGPLGGTEVSADLLAHARSRLKALGFSGDRLRLELAADRPPDLEGFRVFSMVDVLHHIPKARQPEFLRNLAGAMPSGSRFVLKDIDAGSALVVFNKLHDLIFAGNGFQEIAAERARGLMEDAGLAIQSIRRIRRLWYPHYLIVASKP